MKSSTDGATRRPLTSSTIRHLGVAAVLVAGSLALPRLAHAQDPLTTFVGGSGEDEVNAAVFDSTGAILIAGTSDSPTLLGESGTELEPGTGFVAKLSPDGSSVQWLVRLQDVFDLQLAADDTIVVQQLNRVAALAGDGSDYLWEGPAGAEVLEMAVGRDGKVAVLIGDRDMAFYAADGVTELWSKGVGRSEPAAVAIDPVTGDVFVSGDTNTNTGFEPWRSPFLFRYRESDGERLSEMYDWPGPDVRADGRQYQADSFVTQLSFTPTGEMWIAAGSDGGNTVLRREPDDLDVAQEALEGACFDSPCFGYKGAKKTGMFARLTPELDDLERASWVVPYLKMPPATTQNPPCGCKAGSFQGGTEVQPGSFSATDVLPTESGVVVLGEPWGEAPVTDDAWFPKAVYSGGGIGWVGQFDANLSIIEFSSMLPGTKSAVGDYRGGRLLVAGRAQDNGPSGNAEEANWDNDFVASAGSLQSTFGGGDTDGYLLVACLTTEAECNAPPAADPTISGSDPKSPGADPTNPSGEPGSSGLGGAAAAGDGDGNGDGSAGDSGGCGCRTGAPGGASWWWLALGVLGLAWGRRRTPVEH